MYPTLALRESYYHHTFQLLRLYLGVLRGGEGLYKNEGRSGKNGKL